MAPPDGERLIEPLSLGEPTILVVDDSPENCQLVRRVLEAAGLTRVVAVSDPKQALDTFLEAQADLVLLDLHMPDVSGYDLLRSIRERVAPDQYVPILVFTADSSRAAMQRALERGASDFISKPFDPTEFLLRVLNFLETRRLHLALTEEKKSLEAQVEARTQELSQSRAEALVCLARAAEFRDDATGEHTARVANLSARIAEVYGLDSESITLLRMASPLHDVGKIGIPDAILLKPGRLTPDEFETMKAHTLIGGQIIGDAKSPLLRMAREIALHHHERWDGAGYPEGLGGQDIPVASRIVAVADVFDALTHDRPYKAAWTLREAQEELIRQSGRHFDPEIVEAFACLW